MNTQLKQFLKEPLEDTKQFKEFQERIYQFLIGFVEMGKLIGQREAYQRGYDAGREDEQGVSKKGGM